MGGEGSIAGMINSLKENKRILRTRKFLNKSDELIYASKKIKLKYKLKATKEELSAIRTKINSEKKRNLIIGIAIFVFSVAVGALLFYLLYFKAL